MFHNHQILLIETSLIMEKFFFNEIIGQDHYLSYQFYIT